MNLLLYKAPTMMTPTFNARISGNHLIASLNDDTPIFSLNVSEDPSFWIEGGTLMVSLTVAIRYTGRWTTKRQNNCCLSLHGYSAIVSRK